MIHVFFGQEDFLKERALTRLKNELGDPQMLSLNTTVLDAPTVTLDQLRAACDTVPFLAPQRLVLAKGLLGKYESGAEVEESSGGKGTTNSKGEGWKSFAEYLGAVPDFTILVLLDGQLSQRNPLLKALRPLASVVEFRPLVGASLLGWVTEEIESANGKISGGAARLLVDIVGNNLWILSSEINKLAAYTRGRTVTEQDVKQLVAYAREANIFAMVDAIVERRQPVAMRTFHQLLDEGVTVPYLVVMVLRQYRLILQLKLLQDHRLSARELMSKLGITRDFLFEKAQQQASRYSVEAIGEVYNKLLELDVSIKTGLVEGTVAMEMLVAELSGTKSASQRR